MTYAWLILSGFAVFYTLVVFWFPVSEDFPPLWSRQNTTPRTKILLVHVFFLGVFLSLLWLLSWREQSFRWLVRGTGFRYPAVLQAFFVASFMGVIERLWLSGAKPQIASGDGEEPTEAAPMQPGIPKGSE